MECNFLEVSVLNFKGISWIYPPPSNISPLEGIFEDDFSIPQVGYVSSLEGILFLVRDFFCWVLGRSKVYHDASFKEFGKDVQRVCRICFKGGGGSTST